jgi:hypothetical protein
MSALGHKQTFSLMSALQTLRSVGMSAWCQSGRRPNQKDRLVAVSPKVPWDCN